MQISVLWGTAIAGMVIITWLLVAAMKIIHPHERGLLIVLGRFRQVLEPGLNVVPPLVSKIVRVGLCTQKLDVAPRTLLAADNAEIEIELALYINLFDPRRVYFEVKNYRRAPADYA